MSTIKSSDEHLTLNADGSSKDIKFQANGVEKASISSSGAFTSTTIDATKLTGDLPAISGANLTGISSVGGDTGADFNDNVKIRLGTGNDIEMYFDGSKFYVKNAGTHTRFNQQYFEVNNADGSESVLSAYADGAVTLRYNNSAKIETTASGVQLGGNCIAPDAGSKISVGTSSTTSILNVNSTDSSNFAVTINGARASGGSGSMVDFHENSFGGNRIGTITSNGSSIAYNTSSDYRLKENVDYTWDATTRLKQLKPARFNFIADDTDTLVDGFIAHEVSSIVPEAVTGEKDAMATETFYTADDVETQGDSPTKLVGDVKTYSSTKIAPQGIDQSKLVPLLVKTIQELEARITALES
jgi:hypothetical protein